MDLSTYQFTRETGDMSYGPCTICGSPHTGEGVFARIEELNINVGKTCLERAYASLSDPSPKAPRGRIVGAVAAHPDGPDGRCDRCGNDADRYLIRSTGAYCDGCAFINADGSDETSWARTER